MLTWMCFAGQNLSDASKLGQVDLDINGEGGVLLQSRVSSLAQGGGSGRRIALGSHALNGLLQWEHSAKKRQKVRSAFCTFFSRGRLLAVKPKQE